MKITTKTTKQELKNILGANVKAIKEQDNALYERIAYASKMAKTDDSKVTRKDLVDLVKEAIAVLGDKIVEPALAQEAPVAPAETPAPVEPKAENSVKKLSKGVSKKQEPKTEEPATEVKESEKTVEDTTEAPATEKAEKVDTKKSAKKSLGGKKKEEAPKKDGVTVLNPEASKKAVQLAKMFPQTLEVGDSKYELAPDIKTMEDMYNALNNDEEIVIAYYWTKRHLRQFPYFNGWLGQPKSFDNDLDLATAIYVSDEQKVSYQVSMYTEAVYTLLPEDFEEEDGIRVAGGSEYQIYRAV